MFSCVHISSLVLIIVQCLQWDTVNGDVFSAVQKMNNLAREEIKLMEMFQQYKDYPGAVNIMPQNVTEFYDYLLPTVHHSYQDNRYAEHPVQVIHLLQRYVTMWPHVYSLILCDCCVITDREREFNESFSNFVEELGDGYPTEYDLIASARSLLRLRITHVLDIEELIEGRILGEQAEPLTWPLMVLIMMEAEELEMYDEVITWCDTATRMLPRIVNDVYYAEMHLRQIKARIYDKLSLTYAAAKILEEYNVTGWLSVKEDYQKYLTKIEQEQEEDNQEDRHYVQEWKLSDREMDNHEKQLCRGIIKKTPKQLSKLKCYYSKTKIPYFVAKAEEMNIDPTILVFHDVLYDNEIRYLQETAYGRFSRSGLQVYGKGVENSDDSRISHTGWIYGEDNPIPNKLRSRVRLITGLDTTLRDALSSVEAYQVANYGIGGHFNTHYDNLYNPIWGPPSDEDALFVRGSGDRLATWMFYLEDVKEGGATIYPNVNTRISVEKGAAAFWYNLLPNGEVDRRVFHGGCPVLIGSKWIGNLWIREEGQMFTRPCRLDYEATQ